MSSVINEKDSSGRTSLLNVCCQGHVRAVLGLLAHQDIDVNLGDNERNTALQLSAVAGHVEIINFLLNRGANVNALTKTGATPLNLSCQLHQKSACTDGEFSETKFRRGLESLLSGGADVNLASANGWTPAHNICSDSGSVDLLQLLIGHGADLAAKQTIGKTPLMIACQRGFAPIVAAIVKLKINLDDKGSNGETALWLASKDDQRACVIELIARKCDLNIRCIDGTTSLWVAAYSGNSLIVQLLTQAGANVNLQDNDGRTSLWAASQDDRGKYPGRPKCKKILSTFGAKLGVFNEPNVMDTFGAVTDLLRVNITNQPHRKQREAEQRKKHVMETAVAFLQNLNISDAYLDPSFNLCFCITCHTSRGDKPKYRRGTPPKDYGLPIGWCKFGLKLKPQAEAENIFQYWHVAFHGTQVPNVKKILKNGDLLKPGDVTYDGQEIKIPSNHWNPRSLFMKPPPGHDVKKLYFSPSIKYSGGDTYAPKYRWTDPTTDYTHNIRAAFQVRIKPGSYDVTAQTIGATSDIDPLFPNSELEWSTKRFGVAMLVGLLIKVDGEE